MCGRKVIEPDRLKQLLIVTGCLGDRRRSEGKSRQSEGYEEATKCIVLISYALVTSSGKIQMTCNQHLFIFTL